ncbi:MAG: sodium:proton antiporter [Phycisphaerales bacterium]|nr:sodium:proton antiporter [Phycisphaerales bacterium]
MSGDHGHHGFHGPKCWVLTLIVGLVLGAVLSFVAPASYTGHGAQTVEAPHGDGEHGAPGEGSLGSGFANEPLGDPVTLADAGDEGGALPAQPIPEDHGQADPAHAGATQAQGAGAEESHDAHGPSPTVPLWLVIPFALLLLSIAVMPFINERFWHAHYPDFAFLLGGMIIAYYFLAFGQSGYLHGQSYGSYTMLHTGLEYYSFIALIGGLYVASGGVLVDVKGRGGPVLNTGLLAVGAVLANITGTTGASVLLIRPFMRINKGRLKPIHIVLFIFIVSNCGGSLTPIGDPPLYLGYLKGVPFQWTIIHLWPMWAACIGMLLAMFFVIDTIIAKKHPFRAPEGADENAPAEKTSIRLRGTSGMIALALIIAGVFIDPMLKKFAGVEGLPIGPTFQIAVAITAYFVASREILKANDFSFGPVREVGLLFVGIFATMAPALGFLSAHGHSLGLNTPTAFYFGTGALSAVLDNAPTYLNFLQVAFGEQPINADTVQVFLSNRLGQHELMAVSLGAVFFGAMTYIGNGPNFMVRAIAEAGGLRMPSFFGYVLRSVALLLPVLVVIWAIFIR